MLKALSRRSRSDRGLSLARSRAARRRLMQLERLEQRTLLAVDVGTSSIRGTLFADLDADGLRDGGEAPHASAAVFLDLNNDGQLNAGEPQELTDASGEYAFQELAAGEYVVRQVAPAGLAQTAPQFSDTYYAYLYTAGGQMQPGLIDPQTGAVQRLGTPLGAVTERLHGLVRTNSGEFFGVNGSNVNQEFFYSLDITTNQQTQIGQINAELAWGLAYDPASDTIYGLVDSGNGLVKLATFDRTTGQPTLLGPGTTQLTGTSGIAFDIDRGVIVAFDNADDQFWQFDTSGNPALIWDTAGLDGWGLAYDGTMFVQHAQLVGNNNLLRKIDPYRQTINATFLTASEPIPMESLDYFRVDGAHLVYLSDGQEVTGLDFGSTAPGTELSGLVWRDSDGDAVRDAGEPPLPGVVVYLDTNDDGVRQTGGGVEPDDFAAGQPIGDATEGVTLSVALSDNDPEPFFQLQAISDARHSTGSNVFGHDGQPFFTSGFRFRADFDEPVGEVSLDYISTGFFGTEQGTLFAYDASGLLLEQYITSVLPDGAVETMRITRDEADIAYVVAYPLTGFGRLDNLLFGDDAEPFVVSGEDGAYSFANLAPGDYVVREEVPESFRRTAPLVSGARLFATNTTPTIDTIVELDPLTGAVIRVLLAPVPIGSTNTGLAYDGQTLYFLSDTNDTLYELDPDSGAILDSTLLASRTYGGLAAMGGLVYALDSSGDDVLVFDPIADIVTATLDLNGLNSGLTLSDGLGELSATGELVGFNSSNIFILNAVTGKLTNTFPLPSGILAHSLTAVGNEIYVGFTSPTKVDVFRRDGTLIRTLTTTFGVNGLGGGGDTSGAHRVSLAIGQSLAGLDFGNQSLLSEIRGIKWSDNDGDGTRDPGEPALPGVVVFLDMNDDGVRQAGGGVEPDDFAQLQPIGDLTDGVNLTVAMSDNSPNTFFQVQSLIDSRHSTGSKVFGHDGIPFFTTGFRFRSDFEEPVGEVSLDYISSGFFGAEQGTLLAFDTSGQLLAQYTTSVLPDGAVEMMSITRDEADIAYVVAYPLTGFGRLDNLVFETPEPFAITDAQGAYAFVGLSPGAYVVREEVPANYEQTYPVISGARLFATNTSAFPDTILEIHPATGAILHTLPSPVANSSSTVGMAFDGQTLYYLSDSNDTLYELDPETGEILDSTLIPSLIPPSPLKFYGGLAAQGNRVYVLDSLNDDVYVFDPVTDTFTATLDLNVLNPGLSFGDGLGELTATGELLAITSDSVVTINATTGIKTGSFPLASGLSVRGVAGIGQEIFLGFSSPSKVEVFRRDGTQARILPMTFSVNALGGFAEPDDAHRIALGPAQVLTGVDFGNDPLPAQIHGLKFSDSDGDGLQDPGEPPLAGTAIYLDLNGDGLRQFGGVHEPDNFSEAAQINVAVPGVVLTAINSSGGPSSGGVVTAVTDANSSTGTKVFGSFSSSWSNSRRLRIDFDDPVDQVRIDVISDFGNDVGRLQIFAADGTLLQTLLTGTLASDQFQTLSALRPQADIAFAIADSNDFSSVKLDNLRFGDGELEPFTRSAADGTFAFPDLLPGEYVVREEVPENYTQTWPANNGAYEVTLAAAQVITGLLFGNDPDPSEIRGLKWSDLDGDLRPDADEPPLAGVTVYLDANDNGVLDEGELSTVTDADGSYEFTDLLPDEYVVREVVPVGYERTFPAKPRLFASNVILAPNRIFELDPVSGAVINDFVSPFPEGQIFEGIAFDGSVLYLASGSGNTLYQVDADTGAPAAPPVSLPSGSYAGVAALNGLVYVLDFLTDRAVIFDPQTQAIVGSLQINGFNATDAFGELSATGELIAASSTSVALIDPVTGNVTASFPLAAGTFGPRGLAAIGDEIYVGFSNRTTDVYNRSGNRLRTLTSTPDIFGLAAFGSSDDGHRVQLGAGEILPDQDFGNRYILVEMRGTKFDDLDADGQRDPAEPPLAGVTVYLDANDNGVLDGGELTAVTDASGSYAFTGLPAGDYVVREIVPAGYVQTAPREASPFRFLSATTSSLVEPNLASGTLGFVQPFSGFFTGLDTHPQTGLVYAARSTLEVLDTSTLTQTSLGTIRNAAGQGVTMQSISFAPNGTLYGLAVGGQLHTIDSATAVATFVTNVSGFVNSIEFGPDGTLYGAFIDLVTLDPATGQRLRLIESYQFALGDIDFAPDGFLYGTTSVTRSIDRIDPVTGDKAVAGTFTTSFDLLASQFTGLGPIGAHRVHLVKAEVRTGLDFGNHNDPPVADAGGPYDVLEGDSVALAGSGSDQQEDTAALSFVWDLDGDGLYGETGQAAVRGDEVGANVVFSAAELDGPSEVLVTLRIVDSAGAFGEDTALIRVANVAPVIESLVLSATMEQRAVEGQAVELVALFTDVGLPDTHTAVVDWGEDGTLPEPALVSQSPGGGQVTASHAYTHGGIYTVTLTVLDDDGGEVFATSLAVVVGVGLIDGQLVIVGPHSPALVLLHLDDETGRLKTHANFLLSGNVRSFDAEAIQSIIVHLGSGNDLFTIAGDVLIPAVVDGSGGNDVLAAGSGPATLLGGAGNDIMFAGSASAVLVGGDGSDTLVGGVGRDILIGGAGSDILLGVANEDILIGGTTSYDADVAALAALRSFWNGGDSFLARQQALTSGIAGPIGPLKLVAGDTVLDDAAVDLLVGGADNDWLLTFLGDFFT